MADTNSSISSNEGLSTEVRKLMTVVFSVEAILGLLCAFYSLRRSLQRSRGGAVSFYTSLAVADLGIACLCPITAYASASAAEAHGWPFSSDACDAYGFLALFFGSVGIWSLLMTVVEEQYDPKANRTRTIALLVVTWLNALFWSAAPILGWGRYIPESYDAGCLYDMDQTDEKTFTYFISYPIGALVVPLGIMLYTAITSGGLGKSGFQASLLVLVAIFACWGLYCVEEVWVLLAKSKEVIPIELSAAAPMAAKLSPVVNALVVGKLVGEKPSSSALSRRSYKKDK